jgi:hypothetical protein
MDKWLQNYQYRTELSWWLFAGAGIGALSITHSESCEEFEDGISQNGI